MIDSTSIFSVTATILVALIVLTLIRLLRGPGAPNRVVALDTMNTIIVGVLISLSAAFKTVLYVDIAIVYALLSFISTLYIADYIGGKR